MGKGYMKLVAAGAAAAVIGLAGRAQATDYTWVTNTSGTFHWVTTSQNNWGGAVGGPYPNSVEDTATITPDITGNVTIRLGAPIIINGLTLGDADATTGNNTFTINNSSTGGSATPANTLTFQTAAPGGTAHLNIGAAGTATNTISADVQLGGTSDLELNFAGTQNLNLTGLLDINGNTLTITGTGGTLGFGSTSSNPGVSGAGTIVKNNTGTLNVNSGNSTFSGDLIVNRGSVSIINGNFHSASATINGAMNTSGGALGGSMTVGSGSSFATAPNNRLPANITLNSGFLNAGGQPLNTANDTVTDDLDSLRFNSGYSLMTVTRGGDDNHIINVTALERGGGGSGALRGGGGTPTSTVGIQIKVLVDDGAVDHLIGGTGGAGTTNMKIIPWLMGANTNAFAQNPSDWVTYVPGEGLRGLASGEYFNGAIADADADDNVKTNDGLGTNGTKTVNSLFRTSASTTNIGSGAVLSLTSGALAFGVNGAAMGAPGDVDAGTIDFGSAEGVVWTLAGNTNGIGSVLTGTSGFTKTGTGTLVLTGDNVYAGTTNVSGGTLRVGDGTVGSDLGTGDVKVHNGATLRISSAYAIADDASVTLDVYGLHNGKLDLDAGIIETVGSLYFGTEQQLEGTWGSTLSAAQYTNDDYFSGTGVLMVPEPASVAFLGLGALGLLRRRRRV